MTLFLTAYFVVTLIFWIKLFAPHALLFSHNKQKKIKQPTGLFHHARLLDSWEYRVKHTPILEKAEDCEKPNPRVLWSQWLWVFKDTAGISWNQGKRAWYLVCRFTNYVDKILPNIDHLPTSCWLTPLLLYGKISIQPAPSMTF